MRVMVSLALYCKIVKNVIRNKQVQHEVHPICIEATKWKTWTLRKNASCSYHINTINICCNIWNGNLCILRLMMQFSLSIINHEQLTIELKHINYKYF
jgi:hypothetical protein